MRLPAIDGMRGIAAIAVVLFHARDILGWQPAPGGYLAVDLFFVLSGAVIAHAYGARLANGMTWRTYMGRRLVRFLPLHTLGMLTGVAFAAAQRLAGSADAMTPASIAAAAVTGLCFVPYPPTPALFPLNIPAWSLLYELLVNAAYGAGPRAWGPSRGGRAAALALGLALGAGVVLHGDANAGMTREEAPLALLRTLYAFVVGVMLVERRSDPAAAHPLRVPTLILCALAPMLAPVTGHARTLFDVVVVLAGFPLLVRALLATPAPIGAPSHAERFLGVLGDASFGVYALHWPLLWLWNGVARRMGVDPRPGVWIGVMVLVIGCAWLERRVDGPLRARWTARWFPVAR